jgi:hypothetical protein
MPDKPPVYKEFLVGLMVGGLFGPVIGWFVGTFATFFAVTAMDTSNVRSMRGSGFIGRLIGIPLGLATGVIVGLPLRLMSTQGLTFLKNPWLAALVGAIIGWFCGYLILTTWYPTLGSLIYVVVVCMVVGGITGSAAVNARPKWL